MATKSLVAYLAREDFLAKMTEEKNVPHIPEAVFAMLDQKSLMMARLVSRSWRTFVDKNSPLWGQIDTDQIEEVAEAGRVDIMREILSRDPSADIWEAYMLAVKKGDVDMVKVFLSLSKNKNPMDEEPEDEQESSPFHLAAYEG